MLVLCLVYSHLIVGVLAYGMGRTDELLDNLDDKRDMEVETTLLESKRERRGGIYE